MRFSSRLAVTLGIALAGTGTVLGQATASGTIVGSALDPSGAAVAGATVTATNKGTDARRVTTTSNSGQYRFDLLPVGTYTISVQAPGFSTAQSAGVQLLVGTTQTVNLPLTTGQVSSTIEVTANNQLLDVEKTDSSTAVTPQQITSLPLNGRDFANLAILAPGVKLVDSYDPTKNRYAVYAVNGSSGRNSNSTVNGIDNKDNTVGGAVMQLPLEAVEEFKISTNRFSAENGRSEGAALNVVTKSGTNQFHGSLYGFFRSQALQTNNYFAEQAGDPKPDYSRQQYGGSIGGPIRRDHDFGFFAYEGLRERSSLSVTKQAYDELVLAEPLGAQPAHTIPTPFDEKRYNGRLDHVINDKERLYVVYSAQDNKSNNDQSSQTVDLSEGNFTINDLILTNIALSSVLSDHALNTFTAGFQYWNNLIDSKVRTPYFLFPDNTSFGTNPNVPQKSSQHKFQFRDDFSYSVGKHTLRTGVDFVYEPQVGGFFENNPTPEFDFYQTAATLLGDPAKYPGGFSAPGAIQFSTGTAGDSSFNLSPKMLGVYLEDDWRVTRRLLLNLGIRYDRDINTYGQDKQANSRTHQELIAAAVTGLIGVPSVGAASERYSGYNPSLSFIGGSYTGLPSNDNLDISPRIGFSYDVSGNGRFVVRGGYGLYYGQTFENIPLFMIQQSNNLVFANTYSITCAGPGDPDCTDDTDHDVPGTNIPLSQYRYGIDPAPLIPPASHNLAPGSVGRLMDPRFRNPYTQQINAGFQLAVSSNSVFEMEYVQSRGFHEDKTVNINPTEYFNGGIRPFSAAFKAAGVPQLGRIGAEESIGHSYYDALNVSYRRPMSKHISSVVNYTWSKALAFEGNPAAFRNQATNPFLGQLRPQDYGPAPNDERNHVTATGTFELPWRITVSPILSYGSARPLDIIESTSDLWAVGGGRGYAHGVVLTGSQANPQAYLAYLNAANAAVAAGQVKSRSVFYRNCLSAGTCQETKYDSYHGDPVIQLDARFGKTIPIRDRGSVEVFFQGFNLTNRANFGSNFDNVVTDATFLQPLGFVNPTSTITPRSFTGEFGARFAF